MVAFSLTSAAEYVTVYFGLKSSVLIVGTSFNSQMLVFWVNHDGLRCNVAYSHQHSRRLPMLIQRHHPWTNTHPSCITLLKHCSVTAVSIMCVFLTTPVMVLTSYGCIFIRLVDITIIYCMSYNANKTSGRDESTYSSTS